MALRFMRMILFFDLPMETAKQKKAYNTFRKKLKSLGFIMFQKSVYIKLSINESNVELTNKAIQTLAPSEGIISVLVVTENQFASIIQITGSFDTNIVNNLERIVEI